MARTKSANSKASKIRQALSANSSASVKEIVDLLGKQGVAVSANHVYLIKSKARHQKRKQKREMVAQAVRTTGMPNPVEAVQRVKSLAQDMGGLKNLKKLVDVLSE